MGRGRQKAKQMKVARKLKYFSPDTDLDALQRELAPEDMYEEQDGDGADTDVDEPDEEDDLYAKYADFATVADEPDDIDPAQLDESFWTGKPSDK